MSSTHGAPTLAEAGQTTAEYALVILAAAAVLPGATVSSGARPPVGELVTVRVSYRSPTSLPLVGPLLPDPVLVARATMRVER